MPLFTSSLEKRFWLYSLLVLVAILFSLTFGRPLQKIFVNQNVQAVFFLLGMVLVGITILIYGLKAQTSKSELAIWFGLAAVYIMLIFRLGAPERSHLIEYSVLAIFIHKALLERINSKNKMLKTAVLAFTFTFIIGVLDETIQVFLPN